MDTSRRRMMGQTSASPFVSGSKVFPTYANYIEVRDGNIVHGEIRGLNHDMKANVSDYNENTDNASSVDNVISSKLWYHFPAGSIVTSKVTPLINTYTNGGQQTNLVFRDAAGTAVHQIVSTRRYDSMHVGTPITAIWSPETDTDVYCVSIWMGQRSSSRSTVEYEVEVYCDDIRVV